MDDSIKSVSTEDLVNRWDTIINPYKIIVLEIREKIIQMNNYQNELSIIREELLKRGIDAECRYEELKTNY